MDTRRHRRLSKIRINASREVAPKFGYFPIGHHTLGTLSMSDSACLVTLNIDPLQVLVSHQGRHTFLARRAGIL